MTSLKQTPLTCSGHTRPVVHLAFSQITPSGFYLISACKDGKPMLRQGDTGDWIGTFEGHKGAVWGVDLNSNSTRAVTGAADFCAKIWDALAGDVLHSLTHGHIVKSVNFSPDDQRLLTSSNEKLLRIYDLQKIEAEPIKMSGHSSSIRHALFLNDSTVISASDDKSIRLWDTRTQSEIRKLEFDSIPTSIELSRDCKLLSVCHGTAVTFWNTDTWTKDKEFQVPTQVQSATLHPDKTVFVCGGEDFKMYKYDYENGTELESFKGHFGPVHCVRFSPDGELYASGSEDGTLRLWQTTVGKTYGLWRCVNPEDVGDVTNSQDPVFDIQNNSIKA